LFSYLSLKNGIGDIIDIFSLISKADIDWPLFHELAKKHKLKFIVAELKKIISSQIRLPELGLSEHAIARLKKEILATL
jgi:hypothetical protein